MIPVSNDTLIRVVRRHTLPVDTAPTIVGIDDFASEWLHCDRISSYLARMVSHNRTDSLLYANLLSSALNELLFDQLIDGMHQGNRLHFHQLGQMNLPDTFVTSNLDQRPGLGVG